MSASWSEVTPRWRPLDKPCPRCNAKANEQCRDPYGYELPFTHRNRG